MRGADWRATTVAPEGTHHLLDGRPLYAARFREVGKFHAPGLAPAADTSGMYHIDTSGVSVYVSRFRRIFGFYEGIAAVDTGAGWRHITPDGCFSSPASWAWCGNFQGGRCPVRDTSGRYRHILPSGEPAYAGTWRYAGDYRDGVAVVQGEDGRSTHVDPAGVPLHGRSFLDLDVFHKGWARARDAHGWTHVDARGEPAYARRFAMVEPFYNGQARVEGFDGRLEVVDERGETLVELRAARGDRGAPKLLLIGLPGAGKTTIGDALAARLSLPTWRLDAFRVAFADPSVAGDYQARAAFLRTCAAPGPGLYEFGAAGHHRIGVRQAFREAGHRVLTVWVDTSSPVRRARLAARGTRVPLPDWGIAPGTYDEAMEDKLRTDDEQGFWADEGWARMRVDGSLPIDEVVAALVDAWGRFA